MHHECSAGYLTKGGDVHMRKAQQRCTHYKGERTGTLIQTWKVVKACSSKAKPQEIRIEKERRLEQHALMQTRRQLLDM